METPDPGQGLPARDWWDQAGNQKEWNRVRWADYPPFFFWGFENCPSDVLFLLIALLSD